MKTLILILSGISSFSLLVAQNKPSSPEEIMIPDPVPDGSPQPDPPPPPSLQVAPENVLARKIVQTNERRITFERLAPLALPTVPGPPPPMDLPGGTRREIKQDKPTYTLMLGAGVHLPPGHPEKAITRLQLWPSGKEPVILYCNANFLWLTGFATFETTSARYNLLMAISPGADIPGDLKFPDESAASLVVSEGSPTAADLAPAGALLKLYNDPEQLARLRAAYEGRLAEGKRIADERAADPPERKAVVLRYWRLDSGISASSQKKGGAR
jgi:hypothetical protein